MEMKCLLKTLIKEESYPILCISEFRRESGSAKFIEDRAKEFTGEVV